MEKLKKDQRVRWAEDGVEGTVVWVGQSFSVLWDDSENKVYFNYNVFEDGLMEVVT